jgi:hypothetical protein
MGRPRKIVAEEVPQNDFVEEVPQKQQISVLTVDFGRDDMNLMREKLNEIITYLNQ